MVFCGNCSLPAETYTLTPPAVCTSCGSVFCGRCLPSLLGPAYQKLITPGTNSINHTICPKCTPKFTNHQFNPHFQRLPSQTLSLHQINAIRSSRQIPAQQTPMRAKTIPVPPPSTSQPPRDNRMGTASIVGYNASGNFLARQAPNPAPRVPVMGRLSSSRVPPTRVIEPSRNLEKPIMAQSSKSSAQAVEVIEIIEDKAADLSHISVQKQPVSQEIESTKKSKELPSHENTLKQSTQFTSPDPEKGSNQISNGENRITSSVNSKDFTTPMKTSQTGRPASAPSPLSRLSPLKPTGTRIWEKQSKKKPVLTQTEISSELFEFSESALQNFKHYRDDVGTHIDPSASVSQVVQRMKLLREPMTSLASAESKILPYFKSYAQSDLDRDIENKKREIGEALRECSALLEKCEEISSEINEHQIRMFSASFSKETNSTITSEKVEGGIGLIESELDDSLDALLVSVNRIYHKIEVAKGCFWDSGVKFLQVDVLSQKNELRKEIGQYLSVIFSVFEQVGSLVNVIKQWRVEIQKHSSRISNLSFKLRRLDFIQKKIELIQENSGIFSKVCSERRSILTAVLFNNKCARHSPQNDFENSRRFFDILIGHSHSESKIGSLLTVMEGNRKATWKDFLLVHSSLYIQKLKYKLEMCDKRGSLDADTAISRDSLEAVFAASGAVLQAVDLVMDDASSIKNCFCIVRPPGHHAGKNGLVHNSVSQGFCLVNNIAIAAEYVLQNYPDVVRKVAIVDIDVHHGDGTEDIVAGRDDILFISMHAYDGQFYPRSGGDNVAANIINLPLELRYGGELFFEAFMEHGHQALLEFKPDIIFISAGFDARVGDALTPFRNHRGLTVEDYYTISALLGEIASQCCNGRIISALEGGYGTEYLAECAVAHTMGLLDSAFSDWFGSFNNELVETADCDAAEA